MMIKIIYFVGFLISINNIAFGQDTIRIEDIFKKKTTNPSKPVHKSTNNSEFVLMDEFTKVLDEYVYLVESQYQLKKDKNTFGKNGESSFGGKQRMGISVGDEIWSDACLRSPWSDDEDYNEIKEEYQAENSLLQLTKISNNKLDIFKPDSYHFNDTTSKFAAIKFKKFKFNSIGLSSKFIPNGLIVLYYKNTSDTNNIIEKHAYLCSPEWKDDVGYLKELDDKHIIGGFFLNSNFSGAMVTYTLAGIVGDYPTDALIPKRIIPIHNPPKVNTESLPSGSEKKKSTKDKPKITEIKGKK